jgi:hypothetical protein
MSDSNSEVDQVKQIAADLFAARKEIDREIKNLSMRWGMATGPRWLYMVNPSRISTLYWIFLAGCFAAGIVLPLLKGTLSNLGVSLIVGSLFAGGALIGQVWGFAFQERQSLLEKALGDERTKDLENLGKGFWESRRGIDHLLDDKARKQLEAMLTSIDPDNEKARKQLEAMLTSIDPDNEKARKQLEAMLTSKGPDNEKAREQLEAMLASIGPYNDKARKQLKEMLTIIYSDNEKAREQLEAMLTKGT